MEGAQCPPAYMVPKYSSLNRVKKNCSSKAVIFLQEMHSVQKKEEIWNNQWGCGKILCFLHIALQIRHIKSGNTEFTIYFDKLLCTKRRRTTGPNTVKTRIEETRFFKTG